MIDDVGELIDVQPGVERVEYDTGTRHREVQLHMTVAVPRQRTDALTLVNPEPGECIGQLSGALREIAITISVNIAFDPSRHDFLPAVMPFGVGEERRDQQRLLHHQSMHEYLPDFSRFSLAARDTDLPGRRRR